MHELGIIREIFPLIEKIAKENNFKSITRVVLSIGRLRQVKDQFLYFAFETVAKDTIAAGAELIINTIPITVNCHNCNKQFTVSENIYICPDCDSGSLEILTGKEVILESIDGVK